jgi:methylase of polypeptide subunit release factors
VHGHHGDIKQATALDFGCGAARLVVALAQRFDKVTGVDVSSGMLKIAAENRAERGIGNVDSCLPDDGLTQVQGTFDSVHF